MKTFVSWITIASLAVYTLSCGSSLMLTRAETADAEYLIVDDFNEGIPEVKDGAANAELTSAATGDAESSRSIQHRFLNGSHVNVWVRTDEATHDWSGVDYLQFWVDSPGSETRIFELSIVESNAEFTAASDFMALKTGATALLQSVSGWEPVTIADDGGAYARFASMNFSAGYSGWVRIALTGDNFNGLTAERLQRVFALGYYAYKPGFDAGAPYWYLDNITVGSADGLDEYKRTLDADVPTSGLPLVIDRFDTIDAVSVNSVNAGSARLSLAATGDRNDSGSLLHWFSDGTPGTGHVNVWLRTGAQTGDWSGMDAVQFWVSSPVSSARIFALSVIQGGSFAEAMCSLKVGASISLCQDGVWTDTVALADGNYGGLAAIEIPAGFTGWVRIDLISGNFDGLTADALSRTYGLGYYAYKPYFDVSGGEYLVLDNFAVGSDDQLDTYAGLSALPVSDGYTASRMLGASETAVDFPTYAGYYIPYGAVYYVNAANETIFLSKTGEGRFSAPEAPNSDVTVYAVYFQVDKTGVTTFGAARRAPNGETTTSSARQDQSAIQFGSVAAKSNGSGSALSSCGSILMGGSVTDLIAYYGSAGAMMEAVYAAVGEATSATVSFDYDGDTLKVKAAKVVRTTLQYEDTNCLQYSVRLYGITENGVKANRYAAFGYAVYADGTVSFSAACKIKSYNELA